MKIKEIVSRRLLNQQLTAVHFSKAKDLVNWMGAMQAQDFAMSKWAVGIRLIGSKEKSIEEAVNSGEIIRTHVLRPTWHLVAAGNVNWMLDLTAMKIKSAYKARHKELELSRQVFRKTNSILEDSLRDENHLTREELISKFEKAGIATGNNRASHIFAHAELEKLICSGRIKNGKQTYALFSERIPKVVSLSKEESLANIAKIYFASHGPATLDDFVWWAGLSLTGAREAIESIKSILLSETIHNATYFFMNDTSASFEKRNYIFLLPAFDELIIAYKNRRIILPLEKHSKAISNNGMFWPVIIHNGEAVGVWSRSIQKDILHIELKLFQQQKNRNTKLIERASMQYGNFLDKQIELTYSAI